MTRLLTTLALCAALAGCSVTGKGPLAPFPLPRDRQPPCPVEPDYRFDGLEPGANLFVKAQTLLADRELSLKYERELRAVAPTGCR